MVVKRFHTGDDDILALSADQYDKRALITSAWQVYNELTSAHVDIVLTLSQDWSFST